MKTLIGKILTERTPDAVPNAYLQFAQALAPGDFVLTFNYDVLLERALELVNKPYRLVPDRYTRVDEHTASVDHRLNDVVMLKLHGSVDWFDATEYLELARSLRKQGAEAPRHPVFNAKPPRQTSPLVDGPSFPDDPLRNIHRLRDHDQFYRDPPLFLATPFLINPSGVKIAYLEKLRAFWYGMKWSAIWNFTMAIIGFSLPQHDDYARQVIYGLVKNYQTEYWGLEDSGRTKKTLVLVDYRQTPEARQDFCDRYRFVDWNRAVRHLDGFNEAAVQLIFNQE